MSSSYIYKPEEQRALQWISRLLARLDAPFFLCGGAAAIAYGSTRALNDIDLFVAGSHFRQIVNAGGDCITKSAQHYCETTEGWDLEYVQFMRQGIKIEVGNSDGVRIYDKRSRQWIDLVIDFSRAEHKRVFGIEVPVMAKADLVSYKKILGRPVDDEDIRSMNQGYKQ